MQPILGIATKPIGRKAIVDACGREAAQGDSSNIVDVKAWPRPFTWFKNLLYIRCIFCR